MPQTTIATDQVTQYELRLLVDLDNIMSRVCFAVRRRLLDGATVEPGKYSVAADDSPIFDDDAQGDSLYRDGIDIKSPESEEEARPAA